MKLTAFTIGEMLISVAILSTISTIVYFLFIKAEIAIADDEKNIQKLTEVIEFEKSFSELIEQCSSVSYENGDLVFNYNDHYNILSFDGSTIDILNENLNCLFSAPVIALNYNYFNETKPYVDEIIATMRLKTFEFNLNFKKNYSKQFLMNLYINEN